MRKARAKNDGVGYYHLVSRCAFKKMAFGDEDKSMFVKMLHKVAAFSGIDVLAYCAMTNHFHVLVHVPRQVELTESVLLDRLAILYGTTNASEVKSQWDEYRRHGWISRVEKEQDMLRRRMGDISPFMQCLKQRFSIWYRSNHEGHEGTIWQGRFGSTFVESGEALQAVAAYIELNPVRAKIVSDPESYSWSSYGAAMSGDRRARLCLTRIYDPTATKQNFAKFADQYRQLLYYKGAGDILDTETVKQILRNHGKLPMPMVLRCKIRHFTHGFAIGSKEFVSAMISKYSEYFSEDRRSDAWGIGACKDWNGFRICSARRLQKDPITIPE